MPALMMRPAVASGVGLRENNKDAAFASPRLAAVADGVGEAIAGEVASRLAINKIVGLDKRRLEHPLQREVTAAVADADAVIEFVVSYDSQLTGMGTTLTAVVVKRGLVRGCQRLGFSDAGGFVSGKGMERIGLLGHLVKATKCSVKDKATRSGI
jgi:protein phosphatase